MPNTRCSSCQTVLKLPEDAIGKQARCPTCGNVFWVNEQTFAGTVAEPTPVTVPQQPAAPLGSAKPIGGNPFETAPGATKSQSVNPYAAPALETTGPRPSYFDLASRSTRFFGAILDSLILLLGCIPGFVVMTALGEGNDAWEVVGAALIGIPFVAITILNCWYISTRGQSLAKMALRMRIILMDTGEPPGFLRGVIVRAFLPALINQFCGLFWFIDSLWIFSEDNRCLHDHMAGTVVVDAE